MMIHADSKAVRPARLLRFLALAAALCGVLFAASLVIVPPASAEDVTIWSADLDVKTLNTAQDEFGCSESGPFNGQCGNSNVLSDDDFKLHGTTYTIKRIEDDGSDLKLTLNALLPENVLELLTLQVGDTELDFEDASVNSSNKRYTWDSSPSWSSGDDVDLSIKDSSGPSLVKNTSLGDDDRDLSENGHRSAQAFTAGTWAQVTSIGIGIGDEVDDDVEVTLHKGGGNTPGDKLKTLENPSSITEDSVNVFTVPDGGIVLEASKTYFVQVKTTSSDRVAVSVTDTDSDGNDEDAGGAKNWTIDNDSWTNRPSNGSWQESNRSMRIDVKGQVLLPPPTNPSARAVAPMRVTLEWDRTLPSLTGTIDRDDGYKIEWSADGSAPWTSLVNYTNQHGTFDIWCVCYPTRFNDDTIAPGTTRHYRVKAVDDDDESAWSDVVSVTTPALVESDQGEFEFGAVVSTLDSFTDQKVFRFDLDANESYRFRISGGARVIVTGPFSTEVMNEVLEPNNGLKPIFTTQAEGEYQVKISHGGNLSAGRFHFILVPESEPGLSELTFGPGEGPNDVVLNTYGDTDRFGLRVQPGKAYRVRVVGRETAPFLTAATPRIKRANPPSIHTDHNMGKPWVDGVTNSVICPEHGQMSRDCEEFQAFVIDLRGLSGALQTWHIDVSGTQRPDTRPYRVGTYAVNLLELSPSQLAGVQMPLRAWFASPPEQHDGSTRIKVRVAFSDAVDESPQNVGEHGVSVDGGEVTSVRPVDGQATGGNAGRKGARSAGGQDEGPEDREVVWELEIEPDSDEDVTVSLAAWRPCDEPGAICTADGRTLSTAISTTVRGPDEAAAPEPPAKPNGDRELRTESGQRAHTEEPVEVVTLVRNIKQGNTGSERIIQTRLALTFTTGPNTSRYILSNVEVVSDDADSTPFDLSLCTVDSDAQPTSNCKELDGPGSFPAGTLSFDVPPAVTEFHGDGHPTFIWHTLAPNKTYALLFHTFAIVDLGITTNDDEDKGHEEGWTIGNAYLYEIFGTGWVAGSSGGSFRIAIKGGPATADLDTYPLESTDATLSALVVEDGASDLTLTPAFASDTTSYAVSVGYAVDEVTVKPSKSDDNATVEYLDASDNALADADATERGQQAALAVGENTIKVKVTAEDRPTTQTYTVTVTRASDTTPTNPSARAVAPMRVTLEWDRTLPSPKIIDRDDGYKIEWSADGNAPWTSLVNYTNQHGTFDIWCVCYPTRFNDDTIAPGTTRHYRVKAVDDDDESPWSDVVSATTPALVDSDGGLIEFGAVVSELDALNDQKVFRIGLESGEYRLMVRGKAPKHRVTVTDGGGTEIENFVLEAGNGLSPRITAQSPGIHQVKISHGGGFGNAGGGGLNAGWFHFQLVPVSDPAVGTLRLPSTPALSAVLSTYGDVDGAEVAVQPGKAYAVRVRGRETNHGTAATPRIQRANPPSIYTDHNMDKPWVEGVTTAKASPICPGFSEPEKCEFQAFVIDLRGQTGAEQTWRIIVAPTARPRTWPYRVGTYQVDLRELSASQLAGVRMPLRAWFASQHDGSTRIKVRIAFSDAVDESPENVGEHGVSVDGGEVTSVRPMDGQATGGSKASKGARSAGGQGDDAEDREVVWEIEIKPDSDEDVTVSLAAWRPCDEPGAICTADGRTLSTAISTTVRGPDEAAASEPPDKPKGLTATASHDSVTLTWDDPGDDTITGYVILRRNRDIDRKGEFRELVADTGTAATTYTDDTVSAETRYTYRIKAINEHGVSERSRWFHIDTPAAP